MKATAGARPRTALLTHVAPEAPWSGERRRVAAAYSYLSERYDCDLVVCPRSESLGRRLKRKLARPLAPPYCARFGPPGHDLSSYDLLWVYELWALSCLPSRLWSRVIWDKDTSMADGYSNAQATPLLQRWVAWYERRAIRKVQHAFVSLPGQSTPLAPNVTVLPHGYEPPSKTVSANGRERSSVRLGFVGLLDFYPNRDALIWFAQEVLPELRGQGVGLPEIELWVAGGGLSEADAQTLEGVEGVKLCGYVPDLGEFYAGIDLAIAPMLGGAGIPTKVVEALGHGVPVVGTPEGLRGTDAELRAFCVEAERDDWAGAVCRALELRDGARIAAEVRERFSWHAVFDRSAGPVLESVQ
jgi:glycosyltransferase involved in cell wall biosynthesis